MNRIVRPITTFVLVGTLTLGFSACGAEKSRSPLSPNVAGPIAGVTIASPTPVSPTNGSEVLNTAPLKLVFNNASSNGERPFWYVVELASDAGFTSKLFANGRVTPGSGAQTTVVVDGTLVAERTYFWRVKADDGANASEFSATARFDLVVPIVMAAPVPVSPVGGQTTSSNRPTLTATNGKVEGRAGRVEYWFEIATDQAFSKTISQQGVNRNDSGTTSVQTGDLPFSTLLFWRVAGFNGTLTGQWSAVQSFRTPAGSSPAPGPSPAPLPAPPAGGRTPDPAPGGQLPLPNMAGVVQQVAAQFPNALRNSCQEAGGSWEFMDRVVDALRQHDSRWGYNWKRGNVGDPSMDVVDYHFGRGPDEGSPDVYAIDIIGGHCGPNPQPVWNNITDPNGAGAKWTGRGRF